MKKTVRIHILGSKEKSPTFLRSMLQASLYAAILFGPGVLLDSAAMQWAGFLVLLVFSLFVLVALSNSEGMTIAEARVKLDELEAKH